MALLVYVDDIVITGPSIAIINSLKEFIHTQFKLKDLDSLKYFLGLEIVCSLRALFYLNAIMLYNYLRILVF